MNYIEQWTLEAYKTKQTLSGDINSEKIIGRRYEVISLGYESPSLQISVSYPSVSSTESSNQFNTKNTYAIMECLALLREIAYVYPEGLTEASQTLRDIVEYYQQYPTDLRQIRQSSLPQELKIITGTILPTEISPPLTLDFE